MILLLLVLGSPAMLAGATLEVETTVSASRVRLGEGLLLSVIARGDDLAGLKVDDPVPEKPALEDLPTTWTVRIVAERPVRGAVVDANAKTFRYELIPFAAGETTVPQARLTLNKTDGTSYSLLSAPLRVLVDSMLPENADPATLPLKDVVALEPIPLPRGVVAVLLLVGALIIGAIMLWLFRRFGRRVVAMVRPAVKPDQIALEALDRVEGDHLVEKHLIKEHYSRVSDAVRAYLGAVFGIDAMEQTSSEMLAALAETPEARVVFAEVEGLMVEADLVKFAQLEPEVGRCKRAVETGRRIVQESRHLLQPPPEASGRGATDAADARPRQTAGEVRR